MNSFNLKSPDFLVKDDREDVDFIVATLSVPGLYRYKTQLGFEVPLKVSFVDWGNISSINTTIDSNYLLNKNFIPVIADLEVTLGLCSRLGECLFQDLISLNDSLKDLSVAQRYLAKTKENGTPKIVYEKMDFMKHRDFLSEILKSNELKGKNVLENLYLIKEVRKTLCQFIEDRNKYTHGVLYYNTKRKIAVLEYKDSKDQKSIYAKLDQSILVSYINCYSFLSTFLQKIRELQKG